MEPKEKAIFLHSIFYDILTGVECQTILKALSREGLISDKEKSGTRATEKLVNSLHKSDRKWTKKLYQSIENHKLSKVIEQYFKGDGNKSIIWLVQNWSFVQELNFSDTVWILPNISNDATNQECCLEVAFQICTNHEDRLLYELFVFYLQEEHVKTKQGSKAQKERVKLQTEILKFLPNMIGNLLTHQDCMDIATQLKKGEYISKGVEKKLTNSSTFSTVEDIQIVFKGLEECTKINMVDGVVKAIEAQENSLLSQMVQTCFTSKNKLFLLWFAANWMNILKKQSAVFSLAVKRGLVKSEVQTMGDIGLLHLMDGINEMKPKEALAFINAVRTQACDDPVPHSRDHDIPSTSSSVFHEPQRSGAWDSTTVKQPNDSTMGYTATQFGENATTSNPYQHMQQREIELNDSSSMGDTTTQFGVNKDANGNIRGPHHDGDSKVPSNEEKASNDDSKAKNNENTKSKSSGSEQSSDRTASQDQDSRTTNTDKKTANHSNNMKTPKKSPESQTKTDEHGSKSNDQNLSSGDQTAKKEFIDLNQFSCIEQCALKQETLQCEKEEFVVEFRAVVDKQESIPEGYQLSIMVQCKGKKLHSMHPITYQHHSVTVHHIAMVLPEQHRNNIVYKYVLAKHGDKKWEILPQWYQAIVDRQKNAHREQGKHVIFCDVVGFKKHLKQTSEFQSMYSRNVYAHLPLLNPDEVVQGDSDLIMFAKVIAEWIICAKQGVKFQGNNEKVNILPTCKTLLKSYIDENTTNKEVPTSVELIAKSVEISMSILLSLHKSNSTQLGDEKLWKALCKGLCLYNMDAETMQVLFTKLMTLFPEGDVQTLLKALKDLFIISKYIPQSLQLIPLFYLIQNDGNPTFFDEVWYKEISGLIDKHIEPRLWQTSLLEESATIKLMSQSFPKMLQVYQQMLQCSTIVEIIEKDGEFKKLFDFPFFLEQLSLEKEIHKTQEILGKATIVEWIYDEIRKFAERCENIRNPTADQVNHAQTILEQMRNSSVKLLVNACRTMYKVENLQLVCLKIAFKVLDLQAQLVEKTGELETSADEGLACVCKVLKEMKKHAHKDNWIMFGNNLAEIKLSDKQLQETWEKYLQEFLQFIFFKEFEGQSYRFQEFLTKFEEVKPSKVMQASFAMALEHFLSSQDKSKLILAWGHIKGYFTGSRQMNNNVVITLCNLFQKQWESNKESILPILLNWPLAVTFFKFFNNDEGRKLLEVGTVEILDIAAVQIQSLYLALLSGDIDCTSLKQICSSKDIFLEVVEFVLQHEGSVDASKQSVAEITDIRAQQIEEHNEVEKWCQYFQTICSKSGEIVVPSLHYALEQNIREQLWSSIYDCSDSNERHVIRFNLKPEELHMISEVFISQIQQNEIVFGIWKENASRAILNKQAEESSGNQFIPSFSLNEILEKIWEPARATMADLQVQLTRGDLLLSNINEYLLEQYKSDPNNFKEVVASFVQAVFQLPFYVDGDDKVIPDEVIPDEVIPDEVIPDEVIPEEVIPEEVIPDEVIPGDVITDEDSSDEDISDKVITDEDSSDEDSSDEVIPDEVIPGEVIPDEVIPGEDISHEGIPDKVISNEDISNDIIPGEDISNIGFQAKEEIAKQLGNKNFLDDNEPNQPGEQSTSNNLKIKVSKQQHAFLEMSPERQVQFRVDQICNYFSITHQQKVVDIFHRLKDCLSSCFPSGSNCWFQLCFHGYVLGGTWRPFSGFSAVVKYYTLRYATLQNGHDWVFRVAV